MPTPVEPSSAQPEVREARDAMAFGQETGRVLSDGRIVGRAEPFAKVFPSSRAVKRAVGLVAWVILEDIALDARIDDAGRLVSETNVRRIAANLGISKNTVTQHLARLREFGFVLREEVRDEASGRYELTRYVLDPSACIERFTVTPGVPQTGPGSRPGSTSAGAPPSPAAQRGAADRPRPKNQDMDVATPRPKDWDTVTVSHVTGHRELGQKKNKDVVVEEINNNNGAPACATTRSVPAERLVAVGVAPGLAEALAQRHPPELIAAALRAADRDGVRSPSGFVVSALRDGWNLSEAVAQERAARQRGRRESQQADAEAAARGAQERQRVRTEGWSAAISVALDDHALARAIAVVTRPVPGVGRRSAPVVHAELITWAAAVACRDDGRSLREALLDDLAQGPTRPGPGVDANLPDPPTRPGAPGADLTSRITACLRTPHLPGSSHGGEAR